MRQYYRRDHAADDGWAAVDGMDPDVALKALGPGWRLASGREIWWMRLNQPRFSWVDVTVVLVISAVVNAILKAAG